MVKVALEQTPPELAKDIVDQGVILSGVCLCSEVWLKDFESPQYSGDRGRGSTLCCCKGSGKDPGQPGRHEEGSPSVERGSK